MDCAHCPIVLPCWSGIRGAIRCGKCPTLMVPDWYVNDKGRTVRRFYIITGCDRARDTETVGRALYNCPKCEGRGKLSPWYGYRNRGIEWSKYEWSK